MNSRFPPEIISHGVRLYHRFCLSFRDLEELLAQRGIIVSYEAIRQWCRKFGPEYARKLKRRQGRLGDVWHLDEVFVKIRGKRHYPVAGGGPRPRTSSDSVATECAQSTDCVSVLSKPGVRPRLPEQFRPSPYLGRLEVSTKPGRLQFFSSVSRDRCHPQLRCLGSSVAGSL